MKIPTRLSHLAIAAGLLTGLSACAELDLRNIVDTAAVYDENLRPPNAEPGACYGHIVSPAVIETIIEQVLVQAQGENTPVYRTETQQKMLRDREYTWFETPCPTEQVQDYNASLQRALKARGYYAGPITGNLDGPTRRAIRKYQSRLGLDSPVLSLANARALGLALVEISDISASE